MLHFRTTVDCPFFFALPLYMPFHLVVQGGSISIVSTIQCQLILYSFSSYYTGSTFRHKNLQKFSLFSNIRADSKYISNVWHIP